MLVHRMLNASLSATRIGMDTSERFWDYQCRLSASDKDPKVSPYGNLTPFLHGLSFYLLSYCRAELATCRSELSELKIELEALNRQMKPAFDTNAELVSSAYGLLRSEVDLQKPRSPWSINHELPSDMDFHFRRTSIYGKSV